MSSTKTDTLVPSLYERIETRSTEVLLSQPLPHLVGHHLLLSNVLKINSWPTCESLYMTNTPHHKHKTKHKTFIYFINIFCIVVLPIKTLLFGSTLLKHGRHVDYWNQPLTMCIWYLDFHEAGLCCYLVIHTKNLLCPLQLFYFHLWPTYRFPLIYLTWAVVKYKCWMVKHGLDILSEMMRSVKQDINNSSVLEISLGQGLEYYTKLWWSEKVNYHNCRNCFHVWWVLIYLTVHTSLTVL
jgi:hypothetical protein